MEFGVTKHPITGQPYAHKAVDMSNWRAGDTLVSTLDSVVYAVGYTMNDGNYVVLQKGKVLAFYAHLKDTSVKPGDKISTGTVIGHIGNTGMSTAAHLHYGIFICDDSVNLETIAFTESTDKDLIFPEGYWIDPLPLLNIPKA